MQDQLTKLGKWIMRGRRGGGVVPGGFAQGRADLQLTHTSLDPWRLGHASWCDWQRHELAAPSSCACGYLDRVARSLTVRRHG